MAKNWTVNEALEALKANDKAAIADFGKRFPIATVALVKAGEGIELFVSGLPEHVTMRKIESNLKGDVEDVATEEETDVDTEETEEEEVKPAKKEKKAATSEDDKKAAAKARREARKAKKAAAAKVEDDTEDEEDEEPAMAEPETPSYEGMNAVDLFKLCKKRGITAQPKQKANVYVELLKAADEAAANTQDEEDDDWGDEEEEAPKAKKEKAPKKSKKEEKPADDEDDDWDI